MLSHLPQAHSRTFCSALRCKQGKCSECAAGHAAGGGDEDTKQARKRRKVGLAWGKGYPHCSKHL